MKKSQVITLLVLLVVLGLSIAGYFVGKQYFADKEKKDEEANKTTVIDVIPGDVLGFTYSFDGKTYTVIKDGDKWKNDDDKKMKLNQSNIDTMVSSIGKIKASTVIDKPGDLEEFGFTTAKGGLKPETQEILLKTKDKEYDIYVGKANPYDSGSYYIMLKGDPKVYLVDYETISEFQKTLNEQEEEASTENVGVVQ